MKPFIGIADDIAFYFFVTGAAVCLVSNLITTLRAQLENKCMFCENELTNKEITACKGCEEKTLKEIEEL